LGFGFGSHILWVVVTFSCRGADELVRVSMRFRQGKTSDAIVRKRKHMKNCKKCMKNCKNCISTTSCWTATLLSFADKRMDQWTYQLASTYSDYVVFTLSPTSVPQNVATVMSYPPHLAQNSSMDTSSVR
jgi:hypothetical protein